MTFDEFVGQRLGPLLRYAAVVTCDPHLAEDIVQEVLIRAQGRWSKVVRLDQPEAYLKRMVLNEFLSWRRRRASRVVPMTHDALATATAPAGDQTSHLAERDEMLRRIAALPPRQRTVIALRYYEGLADCEIGDLINCAPATVRSHAAKALASLRATIATESPASAHREGR